MDIQIATSTISDISTYVATTVSSLWVVIMLVISIPLSFYIIRKIIQMFPKR